MSSYSMPDHDALIIGSGPNGLAAAIHLARSGWKVKVIEGAETIGGGTRTKELTLPGFKHDVCSAVHPMGVASPFMRALELERHGLRWLHPDVPLAHPLENGRAAVLHRSFEDTCTGLGKDAAIYRRYFGPLVKNGEALFGDILKPARLPRHPITMIRFGIGALMPAMVFASCFDTEEGRALFGGSAAHSIMPLEKPFTSAIGLVLQVSGHAGGWPIPEGGSHRITETMAAILRDLGGEIECGWPVKSLDELPPAKALLFDVSPRNLSRICGEALPARYRRKLEAYRHGPGVFKVDYALGDPIPWTNEWCRQAGTVHVGGTIEEIAASEREAWFGKHSAKPFVLVSQPTIHDPSRAPAGKHVAWAYCHVPSRSTTDMLDTINTQIERFAPGFRDCILAQHTMNCADIEAHNPNYIGGDVIGGVTDWRQLFTRPAGLIQPYATPNPRVFICSASTPPGGGVHGMCGYWAARCVLKRVRR
jgi:phytoene dehydrogenase-like protein